MAWTPLQVFVGNPIKASEFNALQANIEAQAAGDLGAPKQQQAGIDAGAVGQGQLKTTSGSVSFDFSSVSGGAVILPGGDFGFLPKVELNIFEVGSTPGEFVTTGLLVGTRPSGTGGTFTIAQNLYFGVNAGNNRGTADALQTYVEASPPFNIGYGECEGFIFAKINSAGDITATYAAGVPPWAYNGPTSITPNRTELVNGKLKKYKTVMIDKPLEPWKGGDVEKWKEGPDWQEIEIDDAVKNADMGLISHPFADVAENEKVLLIDPCGGMVEILLALQSDGESLSQILKSGYVDLKNELDCFSPSGVVTVSADWKNTGG